LSPWVAGAGDRPVGIDIGALRADEGTFKIFEAFHGRFPLFSIA
jgi:hypothetical protein